LAGGLLQRLNGLHYAPGGHVKKIRSLSFLAALAVAIAAISWSGVLYAQDNQAAPTQQSPDTSAPQSTAPSQSSPNAQPPSGGQTSDPGAASDASAIQEFSGTVQKQGDKYVLKDDAGKVYDIDHQAEVSKYDGKRVRVKGMLDDSGKKIIVK
jgi:cytoskeletal protein RodZ